MFTGKLAVTEDPNRWSKDGIVQLRDAQLGVPGVTRSIRLKKSGPFIPMDEKLIVIAVFLLLTLKWQRKKLEQV